MAKYLHYSQGLRGCYMPDRVDVLKVSTRRELKSAIAYDAADLRDAGMIGLSKKAVARFAAMAWREAHKERPAYLPFALPYRDKGQTSYPYGMFLSVATRADYLEAMKEA